MTEARIRIVLDDAPEGGNTWVAVVPINRSYPNRSRGVIDAALEAVGLFIHSIHKEREIVAERLAALEATDRG